jgi:hypothetical protein
MTPPATTNMDPGPKNAPSFVYLYMVRITIGPDPEARAEREYNAPWIRPCSDSFCGE